MNTKFSHNAFSAFVAFALVLMAGRASFAQSYQVVDLGVFNYGSYRNGNASEAWGISANGKVTGASAFAVAGPNPFLPVEQHTAAFIWEPISPNSPVGSMRCLGVRTLGEELKYGSRYVSVGRGVNDAGVVAGFDAPIYRDGPSALGFRYSSSTFLSLLPFTGFDSQGNPASGDRSYAYCTDNSGTVGGGSGYPNPGGGASVSPVAFAYGLSRTERLDLNLDSLGFLPLGSTSVVIGRNTFGNAAGTANSRSALNQPQVSYAVLRSANQWYILNVGGIDAMATCISTNGKVAGMRNINGSVIGFCWVPTVNNGTTGVYVNIPLSSSPVCVFGVNDSSQVVGSITDDQNRVYPYNMAPNNHSVFSSGVAFLWTPQNGMRSLNSLLIPSSPSWQLRCATGINNYGQIVGYGTAPNGTLHAFLLQPTTPNP